MLPGKFDMSNLNIDQGFAALVAALSAFVASFVSIRSNQLMSQISAKQNVVGEDLKDLSHYLYEVVARSVEATKSKSPERFNEKLAAATDAAHALSKLRIRHRYTIPFIFDPIWYLKGIPIYVEHYRHDLNNPRLKLIRKYATELRHEIDQALENYFFYGKKMGYWKRRKIKSIGKKLEKTFLDGRSKSLP